MKIPESARLIGLRRRIFDWFDRNGRELPWRSFEHKSFDSSIKNNSNINRDSFLVAAQRSQRAYRVLVSEIMLQQTTTKTVSGYFDRFIARFPDVTALAEADISDVLHLWEGLGYYRRAHQLHKAARIIADEYAGIFPDNREAVLKLPGIGRYTAGAILSLAFDLREPILEANTIRLHSRLIGLESDPMKREGNTLLWNFAEKILPKNRCGRFNQALMDLGSLVCTIEEPQCRTCPGRNDCEAARTGCQTLLPNLEKKREKEHRTEAALLLRAPKNLTQGLQDCSDEMRFLLVRYPSGGRWTGLWDFPRFLQSSDALPDNDPQLQAELEKFIRACLPDLQVLPHWGKVLRKIRHTVTRFRIDLLFCDSQWGPDTIIDQLGASENSGRSGQKVDRNREEAQEERTIHFASGQYEAHTLEARWFTLTEARAIPFSSTGRKILSGL